MTFPSDRHSVYKYFIKKKGLSLNFRVHTRNLFNLKRGVLGKLANKPPLFSYV